MRPVRLLEPAWPSPVPTGALGPDGRSLGFARVRGRALARAGVREGDHVLVLRADPRAPGPVADGALALVADRSGCGALWRVRRDRDALALLAGPPGARPVARTGPFPVVQGVVVGVLRKCAPAPDEPPAVAGRRGGGTS